MEAQHASRQARLAALREIKAEDDRTGSTSTSTSTAPSNAESRPIHPFRRAFLLSRQGASLRSSGDAQGRVNVLTGPVQAQALSAEASARTVAEESSEGQLLRRFRNWDPMTGQARQGAWNTVKGVEDEVKGVQEAVLAEDAMRRNQELDLLNIAPKKANWDLRRHMDKRLKKLEKRDKEARLILIRERLKASRSKETTSQQQQQSSRAAEADLAMSTVGRTRGRLGVGEGWGPSYSDSESESESGSEGDD